MICEMEVVSDSSCDSVIISGPIPDYPELRRRKTNSGTPLRNKRRKDNDDQNDIALDDKVEKIQELEDLVNATASIPIGSDNRGDGDTGNWSGSDTRSLKGGKSRNSAGKYLKKIKTLQQNKRRQETRISRLTKEVRSLRDKNSVQAAYIDVLCGMLGEDMKEKFRDRQGLGILGNVKADDEDRIGGEDGIEDGAGAGAWCPEEGENGARNHGEESEMQAKERDFYCVEELDNLPSTSCSGVARNGSVDDLPGTTMGERTMEHDGNGVATDKELFLINNGLENEHVNSMDDEKIGVEQPEGVVTDKDVFLINNGLDGHVNSMEDEKIGVEKPEGVATDKGVFFINNGLENGHVNSMEVEKPDGVANHNEVFLINNGVENGHGYSMEDEKIDVENPEGGDYAGEPKAEGAEESHHYGSAPRSKVTAVEYKGSEVACHDAVPVTENACHEFDSVAVTENGCHQYDTVPVTENGCHQYDTVPVTENACHEYDAVRVTENTCHEYDPVPVTENECHEYNTVPVAENVYHEYDAAPVTENVCHQYDTVRETENHSKGFGEAPERQNEHDISKYQSLFHYSESENHPLPVTDIPKTANQHFNIQELLENGNHFLNFKDATRTENGLIQDYKEDSDSEEDGHGMNGCVSSTNEDVETRNVLYDQQQT